MNEIQSKLISELMEQNDCLMTRLSLQSQEIYRLYDLMHLVRGKITEIRDFNQGRDRLVIIDNKYAYTLKEIEEL